MKSWFLFLVSFVLLFISYGANCAFAWNQPLKVTWDSLPDLKIPDLFLETSIRILITDAPDSVWAEIDKSLPATFSCDVYVHKEADGNLILWFGYQAREMEEPTVNGNECETFWRIGLVKDGQKILHCQNSFVHHHFLFLPLCRIGEVIIRPAGCWDNGDSCVVIMPVLEPLFPDGVWPHIAAKPIWSCTVTFPDGNTIAMHSFNDCASYNDHKRIPCKPQSVALSKFKPGEPVHIQFYEGVFVYLRNQSTTGLHFETGQLDFWYDVLAGKKVEK